MGNSDTQPFDKSATTQPPHQIPLNINANNNFRHTTSCHKPSSSLFSDNRSVVCILENHLKNKCSPDVLGMANICSVNNMTDHTMPSKQVPLITCEAKVVVFYPIAFFL